MQSGVIHVAGGGSQLAFNRSDDISYGGVISGIGKLVISGSGKVTLTGDNTLTGATTVSAGKLVVDGTLAGGLLGVAPGGTLGGHGQVGAITLRGLVAPGNAAGTLKAGSASFQAAAVMCGRSSTPAARPAVPGTCSASPARWP